MTDRDPMADQREHNPDDYPCPEESCGDGFNEIGALMKHVHDAHGFDGFEHLVD